MRVFLFMISSVILLTFLLFPSTVGASGFYLKTIGDLNVEGGMYSQIWYTGESVTFTGVALANETVTSSIDNAVDTTTADASGNWSYSTTLAQGDHEISFSTPSATALNFTLTIGETPEGVGSIPAAETPPAGVTFPTILTFLAGIIAVSSSVVLAKSYLFK
jgi:hypothetical protein